MSKLYMTFLRVFHVKLLFIGNVINIIATNISRYLHFCLENNNTRERAKKGPEFSSSIQIFGFWFCMYRAPLGKCLCFANVNCVTDIGTVYLPFPDMRVSTVGCSLLSKEVSLNNLGQNTALFPTVYWGRKFSTNISIQLSVGITEFWNLILDIKLEIEYSIFRPALPRKR